MLCVLTLFTGCKEVMGSLDNPVSSYFELTETTTKIYRGQTYQIKYTTISDAKPVFKSADEKIALVDPNTGVITGANKGKTKITVELPATTNYNAASKEFEVEVDALLSLPATEKEIAKGATYDLGVKCESDGVVTYKSSNTKVATVDNTGKVTAVASGDATITVSVAATPKFDRSESAEFTAKVRIQTADHLLAEIGASDNVVALLGENVNIELTEPVNLTGKKVTIKGEEGKPASIKVAGAFTVNNNFILENVNVDASALTPGADSPKDATNKVTAPLILFPAVSEVTEFDKISFTNCKISGTPYQLIYACKQKYLIGELKVENSIIYHNGNNKKTIFDFNGGGNVSKLIVNKSTIYANPKVSMNGGFFSTQSGQDVTHLKEGATQDFIITNSTLYNITNGNDMNTLRSKDQPHISFTFQNNIIVNCGKENQFYKGFAGASDAKKSTWNVTGNVNNWGGKENSDKETVKGKADNEFVLDPIKVVVNFADAANGDFTQSDAAAGDPRWKK